MIIIEKALKSKLIRTRYIDNGHDCWGNSESTSQEYVILDDKQKDVYSSNYIIHDSKKVLEIGLISLLPENIQKYLDEKLFNEVQSRLKEERYKKYLTLKKEFEKDPIYMRDEKISNIINEKR